MKVLCTWILIVVAAFVNVKVSATTGIGFCQGDKLTYYADGSETKGNFQDLLSCEQIDAKTVEIYVGGLKDGHVLNTRDIEFAAKTINANVMVFASGPYATKPVNLDFFFLQSMNGSLAFADNGVGNSSSISLSSLECWHSNDGESSVNGEFGLSNYPTFIYIGDDLEEGTAITGSFEVGGFLSFWAWDNKDIKISKITGMLSISAQQPIATSITMKYLTYLGGIMIGTASVGAFDLPDLQSLGCLEMAPDGTTLYNLSTPSLQLLNPLQARNKTAALIIGASTNIYNAHLGTHLIKSTSTCDCSDASKGFDGCKDLCTSSFVPDDPVCTLKDVDNISVGALLKALGVGVIVAIVLSVVCFCGCVCGLGYWISNQKKKMAAQDALQQQGVVANPVAVDSIPRVSAAVPPAEGGSHGSFPQPTPEPSGFSEV